MVDENQRREEKISELLTKSIQRNLNSIDYLFAEQTVPKGMTKKLIEKRGTLNLYHYHPVAEEIYRIPVLIVMALTNKAYVLDLPGQSFIEFLLSSGYDVYVIDWVEPRNSERTFGLETYTQDFIPHCAELICERSGQSDVTILGYCLGGLLSVIYAATHQNGPIKNLICFTTPVSWKFLGAVNLWTSDDNFDVDQFVDNVGIVPADVISAGFDLLRPKHKVKSRRQLWENMWNTKYVEAFRLFDKWGNDITPVPGELFRDIVKNLMEKDELVKGELKIGNRTVSLENIKTPTLSVVAKHDDIILRPASQPLIESVSSEDKEEIVLDGGHVSVVAGPQAKHGLWPKLDGWLSVRSV